MRIMETNEKRSCCGGGKSRIGWIILGIVGFTACAFLFGAVVMWLWNWLMPAIFHLGIITYWQAVGLAVLGRLLFGGLHHGHHHRGRHGYGAWKYRHHGSETNCRDFSHGSKWSYYDQYWNEEGEKSFNDYVKRKSETAGTE
jgi:hypothetical protein